MCDTPEMHKPGIDSETIGEGLEARWDCVSSLLMRNDKRQRGRSVSASLITALVCCDSQNTQSQRNNTQVASQSITIYMLLCLSSTHTHTHIDRQTDRQTDTHAQTDTHTHIRTRTHTHAHTHAHTHTHAYAHAYAHAHTHTRSLALSLSRKHVFSPCTALHLAEDEKCLKRILVIHVLVCRYG